MQQLPPYPRRSLKTGAYPEESSYYSLRHSVCPEFFLCNNGQNQIPGKSVLPRKEFRHGEASPGSHRLPAHENHPHGKKLSRTAMHEVPSDYLSPPENKIP